MKQLFFWRSWSSRERSGVVIILSLLSCALLYLCLCSGILSGRQDVKWDILAHLSDLAIPANSLDLGGLKFNIDVPSTYVTEQYIAPLMLPDVIQGMIFLMISSVGISVVLASLTTLTRFWYLGGFAVFILLLVFSRTEVLGSVPGMPEQFFLVIALILYGGIGYYLHAFRSDIGIAGRIAVFVGISVLLGLLIGTIAPTPLPYYTLLVYSMPLWLFPALIFLVMCATEIIYGLVWLTTSRATGMGNRALPNLLVILMVYLVILIFAYVGNTRIAGWGIVILPAYLLAGVAALIGLVSFRLRCESSEGQLPFRQSGFWLYAGLFLVTIGMTGMAVVSGNDPLLEVMEDTVVNSQLGMGAAFVFYLFANFLPLLREGLPVHRVLYKPLSFSLVKARIIGVAVVAGLFSMQNLFPVKQGIAAYFNGLGDLYTLKQEYTLAEQYYNMSLQQEFQNHKGNYALASLARIQGDNNAAVFFFRQATLKKPSPQAYIGLSNLLEQDNLYFEAMFNLKEGGRAFPANSAILNNLGVLYARTNLSDSAYYFLSAAEKVSRDQVPGTNVLALMSAIKDVGILDSLATSVRKSSYLSEEANRLLVRNLAMRYEKETAVSGAFRQDSLLSASGYAYWINYAYNQARLDSLVSEKIMGLVEKNNLVSDELLLAAAHADFYSGDKTRAFESLLSLAAGEGKQSALYHKILGHWFLQLGLYPKAIEEFSGVNDPDAIVGHAIAESLSGNAYTSLVVLEKLYEMGGDSLDISRIRNSLEGLKDSGNGVDEVLRRARNSGLEADFLQALKLNPYNPQAVVAYVDLIGKEESLKAYDVVVKALRFNTTSFLLWSQYALLNLDLGLLDQAEEARKRAAELGDSADYHEFSLRYQAKRSFKQKEREEFR